MSYYWFNRQGILEKEKERYSKEKAGEYYLKNKEATKEKSREHYLVTRRKRQDLGVSNKNVSRTGSVQKRTIKKQIVFSSFLNIKNELKTLKFNNTRVKKKELQPIDLMSVNVDQIVISDKFKYSGDGFKYFIGYQEGKIVKALCINLPQISQYINYFENGGKNMSSLIKDHEVREKYEKIWVVIKNKLSIKFHSKPIYDQKYLKAKVRGFDGVVKTNFLGNDFTEFYFLERISLSLL